MRLLKVLKTHHEGTGELLTRNERVHTRLLGSPSLNRVQVQQALAKVDEGQPIVEL